MTHYAVTPPPAAVQAVLKAWLESELRKISGALSEPLGFETLYAEPSRLYDGLTVLADGTTWNPGSGQGVYTYYASAWHKLG